MAVYMRWGSFSVAVAGVSLEAREQTKSGQAGFMSSLRNLIMQKLWSKLTFLTEIS
jgi:hypothetical protein